MLFYFLIILLDLALTGQEIQKPNKNCKNIKCPPVEDPVCVKIKKLNEKHSNATFVVAINKCEIKFARCRTDIEAVMVPMKYCQHNNESTGGKRFKRAANGDKSKFAVLVDKNVKDKNVKDKVGNENNENDGVSDLENDGEKEADENGQEVDNEDVDDKPSNKPKYSKEFLNNIAADYDQKAEDVDYVQYEKDCPSVCPAREVMLCVKCHHNIHRTFMSPCHLRMFNCKYPEEKLQLVSRQPCMQSAPFLTNFTEVKGSVSERGDEDNVLKFIYCRAKERLGKGDPRCNFGDDS